MSNNRYLIDAYKRYTEVFKEDCFINPISKYDAEIIERLQAIVAEYQIEDLYDILTQYKQISDKDFYELLYNYKINNLLNKSFDDENLNEKSKFIKMNDFTCTRLQKRYITDYFLDIVIDAESEKEIPVIVLNEVDPHITKVIAYANRHLLYESFCSRNEDILRLDQIL